MQGHHFKRCALLGAMLAALHMPAHAQEAGAPVTEPAVDEAGQDFSSRDALVEYLGQSAAGAAAAAETELGEQQAALAAAVTEGSAEEQQALVDRSAALVELDAAQAELDAALAGGDETLIAEAQARVDAANESLAAANDVLDENYGELLTAIAATEAELAAAQTSLGEIAGAVDAMSDQQVYWTNQKLQNAKASGLVVVIPIEELEKFASYDFQQINFATKAFESSAKFEGLAGQFEEGSKQEQRFLERAESQQAKFLAKTDPTLSGAARQAAKGDAKQTALESARTQARDSAKDTARQAAKDEARLVAKDTAKSSAKDVARDTAKQAAKDSAKDLARDNAKNLAKQIVQEEGRNVGKLAAAERANEAARSAARADKDNGKANGRAKKDG